MEIYKLVLTSNYEGRGGQGLTVCVTEIYKKINFIGGLKRKDIFNNSLQIRLSHPQKTFQLCNNNFNIIKGFNQDQLLTMHTVVESHG